MLGKVDREPEGLLQSLGQYLKGCSPSAWVPGFCPLFGGGGLQWACAKTEGQCDRPLLTCGCSNWNACV